MKRLLLAILVLLPLSPIIAVQTRTVRVVTSGCGVGLYCPSGTVTREQMAAFLVRAFGL